jgi:putative transposase
MTWLTGRLADGRPRVIGATVTERAGRWWISFPLDLDRCDVNERRTVSADAPAWGIEGGFEPLLCDRLFGRSSSGFLGGSV